MMPDYIWGWSSGGHKSHAWLRLDTGRESNVAYAALCDERLELWTTEKGSFRPNFARCKRCVALAAKAGLSGERKEAKP